MDADKIIDKLYESGGASLEELEFLIDCRNEETAQKLFALARSRALENYGNKIYVRGLVEISSFCKNDCLYCGIRRSNKNAQRYRLTKDEILECCREGWALGFRTFVLQGGEDAYYTDDIMTDIVASIRAGYPDCAITLSLGEKTREATNAITTRARTATSAPRDGDARALREAPPEGALAREPHGMPAKSERDRLSGRLRLHGRLALSDDGGPRARPAFHKKLRSADGGHRGPFIPHHDTPFADKPAGTAELTLFLLAIVRLMNPKVLLPATTALGTIEGDGRERGILAGCNVVMPNLSPQSVRKKYMLYDDKLSSGEEAAEARAALERRVEAIGYRVVTDRGDYKG